MLFRITSWYGTRRVAVNIHGQRVTLHRHQLPRWRELQKKQVEVGDVLDCEVTRVLQVVRGREVDEPRA